MEPYNFSSCEDLYFKNACDVKGSSYTFMAPLLLDCWAAKSHQLQYTNLEVCAWVNAHLTSDWVSFSNNMCELEMISHLLLLNFSLILLLQHFYDKIYFKFEKSIYNKSSNTADNTILSYYVFLNGNYCEDSISKTQIIFLK